MKRLSHFTPRKMRSFARVGLWQPRCLFPPPAPPMCPRKLLSMLIRTRLPRTQTSAESRAMVAGGATRGPACLCNERVLLFNPLRILRIIALARPTPRSELRSALISKPYVARSALPLVFTERREEFALVLLLFCLLSFLLSSLSLNLRAARVISMPRVYGVIGFPRLKYGRCKRRRR